MQRHQRASTEQVYNGQQIRQESISALAATRASNRDCTPVERTPFAGPAAHVARHDAGAHAFAALRDVRRVRARVIGPRGGRGSARRQGDRARSDEQQRLSHTAHEGYGRQLEMESIAAKLGLRIDLWTC